MGGQGLCVYLVDPSIPGWDRQFDGTGPLGFVGKTGTIVGVGIDCTGEFCGGNPSCVAVKAANGDLLCDPVNMEHGVYTPKEEYWRKIHIKFDIEDNNCDVKIGGHKILDNVKFEGVKIPNTVCVGVCAGTTGEHFNHMCVNKLKLLAELDDD